MKSMRRGMLSIAGLLIAGAAAAQGVQSAPIDLAVTYDALHTDHITAQSFWMQVGAVELGARMYRGLGIAARVEGDHAGAQSTTVEPLSLVSSCGSSWRRRRRRRPSQWMSITTSPSEVPGDPADSEGTIQAVVVEVGIKTYILTKVPKVRPGWLPH